MNGYYEKAFWQSRKFQLMMGLVIAAVLKQMGVPVPNEIFWAGLAGIMGVAATDFGKSKEPAILEAKELRVAVEEYEEELNGTLDKLHAQKVEIAQIVGDVVIAQVPPHELPSKTPSQWEKEYLDYFEKRITYYRGKLAMYPDTRFGFAELLEVAEHSLVVAQASVASVKLWAATGGQSGSEPNSLGDIGYRIAGKPVPWEK